MVFYLFLGPNITSMSVTDVTGKPTPRFHPSKPKNRDNGELVEKVAHTKANTYPNS